MSTYWLAEQLIKTSDAEIDHGNPVLAVTFSGRTEHVYCPDPDEYRVTADVVQKAKGLGATVIAYSSSWCDATHEAKGYAKNLGVSVMSNSSFFAYLKRKGVKIKS